MARRAFEKAREGFTRFGDLWGIANVSGSFAVLELEVDRLQEARVAVNQSLKLSHQLNDRLGEAWSMINLGMLEQSSSINTAYATFNRAKKIFKRLGNSSGHAWATINLGWAKLFTRQHGWG